jgi:hypothetical protein
MVAAKNSKNRRAAWSPAPTTIAGTAIAERTDPTGFEARRTGS